MAMNKAGLIKQNWIVQEAYEIENVNYKVLSKLAVP